MGNLKEELELRVESLEIALKEAMSFPEVEEYIKKSKRLLFIKNNKNLYSFEGYNMLLHGYITELDELKETQNVKLFLDLLDKERNCKQAVAMIETTEVTRK